MKKELLKEVKMPTRESEDSEMLNLEEGDIVDEEGMEVDGEGEPMPEGSEEMSSEVLASVSDEELLAEVEKRGL